MSTRLHEYVADHRHLLHLLETNHGFVDPIALDLDEFYDPIMRLAKKCGVGDVDGLLVRDWDPDNRKTYPGIQLGVRLYEINGVRFARMRAMTNNQNNVWGGEFTAISRRDYIQFYRIALKARRDSNPPAEAPVLPQEQTDLLWQNTIGYLDRKNLTRIKEYGGRARRGLLLMGPPGNGKTSACRWIWQECRRRRWDWRLVTPDEYRQARTSNSIEDLFTVQRRGIVFFDDMDLALRDRETVHETDDQSIFLNALDGITINEGVVFLFTTNCSLDLIDRAFKRPGRIDLVLHFQPPTAVLRRELIERWHPEIRTSIDISEAVDTTDGYSFAEVEELKNLLILNFMESQRWDWAWALRQLDINRHDLTTKRKRTVGFGPESNGV